MIILCRCWRIATWGARPSDRARAVCVGGGGAQGVSPNRLRCSRAMPRRTGSVAAVGAAVGFGGFWLLRVVAGRIFGKEALGGGDLWLLAMIGAFLGWQALLPVVFLASLQGSVVGIALLLVKSSEEEAGGAERFFI